MEKQFAIADLCCDLLESFRLSLALDLEDLDGLDLTAFSCVEAVGANEVALRVTLDERLNLDPHAIVHVLHWVHLELAV